MSIDLRWQDPNRILSELRQSLGDSGRFLGTVPERAIRRATFELQALVQREVPKRTSTLVRSITARIEKVGAGIIMGRVGTHLKYAPFVEYGTGIYGPEKRPIVIEAKHKKGLFWGAYDKDGRPIIRRRVVIQGMKPRAPFSRATAQFLPRYVEIVRQELAGGAA